jgi:hypothetical protein
MLKFYTEVYAWMHIRSERQWGEHGDHRWAGVASVSLLMMLHLASIWAVLRASTLPWCECFAFARHPLNPLAVAAVAMTCAWLIVVYSGRGDALMRELQVRDREERDRCERRLLKRMAVSLAIFFTALILLGLVREVVQR